MQSEKIEFMEKQVEYLESLFDLEKKKEEVLVAGSKCN